MNRIARMIREKSRRIQMIRDKSRRIRMIRGKIRTNRIIRERTELEGITREPAERLRMRAAQMRRSKAETPKGLPCCGARRFWERALWRTECSAGIPAETSEVNPERENKQAEMTGWKTGQFFRNG